jgi:UDP-N-acetyl-D-galactosamine dehydrogenase
MLIRAGKQVRGARVAVLGITFKEDVPDLRNTRVVDIIKELEDYGVKVLVNDPLADPDEAQKYYGVELLDLEAIREVDAVILAVMHKAYRESGLEGLARLCADRSSLVVDVKGCFKPEQAQKMGISYWRL